MTPRALADLHARCFTTPRPWSAAEFQTLLDSPGSFLETAPTGFALGRVAGPECELLTLAVAPEARRSGIGAHLLARFETRARDAGAVEALLEVAADNTAARALYLAAGYGEAGQRPGYYRRDDGTRIDALILRKPLGHR